MREYTLRLPNNSDYINKELLNYKDYYNEKYNNTKNDIMHGSKKIENSRTSI